jgi:transposase
LSRKSGAEAERISPALKRARERNRLLEENLGRKSDQVEKLEKENERLRQEVEKLKQELARIRKPPKWAKANTSSDPKKRRGKRKGAKPGHPFHRRRRRPPIDETVVIVPERCPISGETLSFPSDSKWYSHLQIDLPEPGQAIVTEYRVGSSYCRICGRYHSASGRMPYSFYGPRLHATVAYWKYELGLTLEKIQKLLADQYQLDLSTGQLSELLRRSAQKLETSYEDLVRSLDDQPYLHADETGWRIEGDNAWLWSFSNADVSVYTIEKSRGQKVVDEVLGETFGGVLCSDFYGAYNTIDCAKQKCWAHLLRDVHELREKYPKNLEVRYFASRLKSFFRRSVQLREDRKAGETITSRLKRLHTDTYHFMVQRFRHSDLKILAKRLIKYRDELYTFVEPGLEPTNNLAEREIRPAVLMRKTSYGNRSDDGAKNQAILMSMLRTCRKRNQPFIPFATQHLSGFH